MHLSLGFVPVPYCLDDCGFVAEPEVRQVDSSSSIFLSQDCFGYSRFFVLVFKVQFSRSVISNSLGVRLKKYKTFAVDTMHAYSVASDSLRPQVL